METFPVFETPLAVLALARPPSGGGSCNGGSGTGNNVALTGGGALGPVLAVAVGAIHVMPVWVVGVEPILSVLMAVQPL